MGRDILFEPINIGGCKIKNRLVMAPMGNINMADPIGRPLNKMIEYFGLRAKGGCGLLITGLVPVSYGIDHTVEEDNDTTYFPRIDGSSRTRMSGWRDLTSKVHAYDSKIFMQLTAGLGRVGSPESFLKGKMLKSASINKNFYVPVVPHLPLTDRAIKKIVKSFGQCAVNAKACGFDGIHLHGHEGYLMDQLTSKPWNRRKFGRYSNLHQFAIDVVKEIKHRCGDDFPIIYRIDLTQGLRESYGDEIFKKRFKNMERCIEDGLKLCKELAQAGVDAFDVDKGCYDNWFYPHPPAYFKDMIYVKEMAGVLKEYFKKENIDKPVIAVGKMGKPEIAEKVLKNEYADMVMLGRPLLADPYWPDKVKQDKEDEINHCIGDQEGCVHSFIHGGHPCCTVNPYTGFEDVKKLEITNEPKNVAVIGAGPAGIEASKTLIDRNHKVTLFEAKSKIGGQFELNDEISIKHDIKRYLKNQRHIIEKYIDKGLILKLNTKPDIKELEENFDVVILATGVKENIPKIKGVEKVKATTAREFLENKLQLPQNTKEILVVGGGAVGCEIAYTIAKENDVQVTIVEMQKYLMNNIVHSNRSMLLWLMSGMGSTTDKVNDRLNRKVKAYTSSRVVSFKEDEALLEVNKERINPYTPWETLIPENIHNPFEKKLNDKNTEEISIKTDFVIFAMGAEENDDLYEKLKNNKKLQVYNVGDSKKLASAWEAINDANEIARGI